MKNIEEFLNEASINAKKRNVDILQKMIMNNKEHKAIKSFAAFTCDNPDSTELNPKDNKKLERELTKLLKSAGFTWAHAKGKFGNSENSFVVFNIKCDEVKRYCGKFQQTSFIYSYPNDGKLISEYWEKKNANAPYDENDNDYIKKDTCDKQAVDMKDANDYYTVIGNKFKYSIPFSIFENADTKITNSINIMLNENFGGFNDFNEILEWGINRVGMKAAYTRNKMYVELN